MNIFLRSIESVLLGLGAYKLFEIIVKIVDEIIENIIKK